MTNTQNELIRSERTDGVCAVCNGQKKILTEVTVRDPHDAHGPGFVQVCDRCREAVIGGLER